MNIHRLFAITFRYYLLLRDNFTRSFQILVWALLDVVLWGFLTKYLDTVGNPGFSFVPVLLGAVTLWAFMSRAMQGVSTPFLEDVWSRNLLNFFASPLTMGEYIGGLVLASIATSSLGLLAMTVLASLLFGLSLWSLGVAFAAFVILLFIFGIGLGIIAIGIVLRLGPSAEWFVWPIPTILTPFVGVYYPISILPGWMQLIAHIIAPTYVFEGLRSIIERQFIDWQALGLAFVLDLVFLGLAYGFFYYIYKKALRNGSIARYSAESFQ
jgi:ABC-2 type transport system permease protein